eukprot:6213453-Pleurochrysis_carterae.AAC.9
MLVEKRSDAFEHEGCALHPGAIAILGKFDTTLELEVAAIVVGTGNIQVVGERLSSPAAREKGWQNRLALTSPRWSRKIFDNFTLVLHFESSCRQLVSHRSDIDVAFPVLEIVQIEQNVLIRASRVNGPSCGQHCQVGVLSAKELAVLMTRKHHMFVVLHRAIARRSRHRAWGAARSTRSAQKCDARVRRGTAFVPTGFCDKRGGRESRRASAHAAIRLSMQPFPCPCV